MKLRITLLLCFFSGTIALAQKKEFRERALQEADSLIANALLFLGRSEPEIIAAGRPAAVMGGDKWEAEVIKMNKKNSMDASKTIIVGTGCGVLMMVVSAKTSLVYVMTYVPHQKSKLTGIDIFNHLKETYRFDQKGNTIFQAKDSSYIGLSVTAGAIALVAFQNDKVNLRFEK